MNDIKLYNTKSKSLETFTPLTPGKVGIYSCGPTVYHYQHLGNMRAVIFADTLRRMFIANGYDVHHIINITDVGHNVDDGDTGEDKMEKGSKREGKTVWEIAEMYTSAYFEDLKKLGVPLTSYTFPRATDNIKEQVELVQALEQGGYTYAISDGIYFDTSKYPNYVDFAKLDVEGLQSGARIEENKEKKNTTDFALWKFSPKDEQRQMEWDSPWGKGFPGWHIECSAMAMKYLGKHFDVHTGGIEHIPVHHTNEIAQSECATGETYANYWLHNNHLLDPSGKMSKSSGDFLTISSLVQQGYDPLAYRYFVLTAHYRKELAFSHEALDAASTAYKKISSWCKEHVTEHGTLNQIYFQKFLDALSDDLGTPESIAQLWNTLKDETLSDEDKYVTVTTMGEVLGFPLKTMVKETIIIPSGVQTLLDARKVAREQKDFALSDKLRDEIAVLGFVVEDKQGGQEVSLRK